jgi:hypothetical protein
LGSWILGYDIVYFARCFGGRYCLRLQDRRVRQQVHQKDRHVSACVCVAASKCSISVVHFLSCHLVLHVIPGTPLFTCLTYTPSAPLPASSKSRIPSLARTRDASVHKCPDQL